jgi:hypothetical protein
MSYHQFVVPAIGSIYLECLNTVFISCLYCLRNLDKTVVCNVIGIVTVFVICYICIINCYYDLSCFFPWRTECCLNKNLQCRRNVLTFYFARQKLATINARLATKNRVELSINTSVIVILAINKGV